MKKSATDKLRMAVEQYFTRLHGDLFESIYKQEPNFCVSRLVFDKSNDSHIKLVTLCKENLGHMPLSTDQDIFLSILKIYEDHKKN
ncbi:MAG: hypothetical protein GQ574_27385 [Crocinitomix sp.]|nr:hypothetical protein [Crocinitomix sp.]